MRNRTYVGISENSNQVRYGWTQGQIQEETVIHIQQIQ